MEVAEEGKIIRTVMVIMGMGGRDGGDGGWLTETTAYVHDTRISAF